MWNHNHVVLSGAKNPYDNLRDPSLALRESSQAESMLGLHKSLASAQSPREKKRLERQIKACPE